MELDSINLRAPTRLPYAKLAREKQKRDKNANTREISIQLQLTCDITSASPYLLSILKQLYKEKRRVTNSNRNTLTI